MAVAATVQEAAELAARGIPVLVVPAPRKAAKKTEETQA